jgi:hypothetical protein
MIQGQIHATDYNEQVRVAVKFKAFVLEISGYTILLDYLG